MLQLDGDTSDNVRHMKSPAMRAANRRTSSLTRPSTSSPLVYDAREFEERQYRTLAELIYEMSMSNMCRTLDVNNMQNTSSDCNLLCLNAIAHARLADRYVAGAPCMYDCTCLRSQLPEQMSRKHRAAAHAKRRYRHRVL